MILRSKYPYQSSNIYNVTASLNKDFPELTIFEKVQRARPVVFPFDYPTPENIDSDEFKEYFETMFISRYIDTYFKGETFEAFELSLYSKMLEIMPVYNAKLDLFFYQDKDKLLLNESKTVTDATTKTDNKNNSESGVINQRFPNKANINFNNMRYGESGTANKNEQITDGTVKTDSVVTTLSGNRIDGLIKFNSEYKTIFKDLLLEFKPLFSFIIHI